MWYLKFKYKHSDCIYASKLQEYNLSIQFFYIGRYTKNSYVYTTALIKLFGEPKNIKKYVKYIKEHNKIVKIETLSNNSFVVLAKHKKDIKIYKAAYDPSLIYTTPAYLNEEGFEVHELICWDKRPLQDYIEVLKHGKTTEYYETLKFVEKKLDDVYVMNLLPKLSLKQEEAIKLAFKEGYYEYPKRTSLSDLAKLAKVSKVTFRENLRKAESKIMPLLVSE